MKKPNYWEGQSTKRASYREGQSIKKQTTGKVNQ